MIRCLRILIAPDKFKGSLTAAEAAIAITRGIERAMPHTEIDCFPMADGGEGTVEALVAAAGGKILRCKVCGPLGKRVTARFGLLPNRVAVIEMAEASGLHLVPPRLRNPMRTTTYGTGELICAAMKLGCHEIIVGIGGSATTDGGAGMAQAVGFQFFDKEGRRLAKPLSGGDLDRIARIAEGNSKLQTLNSKIIIASDVSNPLLGKYGAARVFGPQKGATPAMVAHLERNLRHFARIVVRDLTIQHFDASTLSRLSGSGAAGGLGFGLRAFLSAEMQSGAEIIMNYGQFEDRLRLADLVITGEGKLDEQSLAGKAPVMVAQRAKEFDLPVLALAGSVAASDRALRRHGIDAAAAIKTSDMSLDYAMQNAARLLEDTVAKTVTNFVVRD